MGQPAPANCFRHPRIRHAKAAAARFNLVRRAGGNHPRCGFQVRLHAPCNSFGRCISHTYSPVIIRRLGCDVTTMCQFERFECNFGGAGTQV